MVFFYGIITFSVFLAIITLAVGLSHSVTSSTYQTDCDTFGKVVFYEKVYTCEKIGE